MMEKRILERRIEVLAEQERQIIAREGFVIRQVIGETVHTHGLAESFGHPELECVLPADPDLIGRLLYDLGERVRNGARFSDGELVDDLIENFSVKLVASPHGLRLILPDPKGELERERMEPAYAAQYDAAVQRGRRKKAASAARAGEGDGDLS